MTARISLRWGNQTSDWALSQENPHLDPFNNEENRETSEQVMYNGSVLEAVITYLRHPIKGIFEKTLRFRHISGKPVMIERVILHQLPAPEGDAWYVGGTGQPAFCGNRYFIAAKFPCATAEITKDGKEVALSQHPGVILAEGDVWTSADVVFGYTARGEIRILFDQYVHHIARFLPRRIWIYGDWALHDELAEPGRAVELTETMTRENVKLLRELKEKHGILFDYYLVDHGWYSRDNFQTVKKPNFSSDGLRWLADDLQDIGMKLGLWFPVNTHSVNEDGIYCGIQLDASSHTGTYCMRSEYGRLWKDSILYAIEQWNVELIKLDFADFRCNDRDAHNGIAAEDELHTRIMEEQEISAFLKILEEIRSEHPHVLFVAFNGFVPSPWWLSHLDTLYIGDVQPSEVPAVRLRTSVNLFTAQQLEKYEESWNVHRDFLDDCGTFIGKTTTNFYLGSEDWKSQALLCLGRGVQAMYYYGDLGLLDEDEHRYMGRLFQQDRLIEANDRGAFTVQAVDGLELFAYVHDRFMIVYNPSLSLYREEWKHPLTGKSYPLLVNPYEAQWIDLTNGSILFASDPIPGLTASTPIEHRQVGEGDYRVTIDPGEGRWIHYLQFLREDGTQARYQRPYEQCTVESNYPCTVLPDQFCWNSVGWLAIQIDVPSSPRDKPWIRVSAKDSLKGCELVGESWWSPV